MSSDRIEALEEALAHAEKAIEDLSDEAIRQAAEIDRLTRQIAKVTRTIEAMAEDDGDDAPPVDQPPPHW